MKRPVLLALLTIGTALASPAPACTAGMTLGEVIVRAEKEFDSNPRSTIHECFRPHLKSVDDEDNANTRERFLYLVVSRTAQRPPRPYNLDLIIDAAEKYFELMPKTQPVRAARVLTEWGRAMLLSKRPNGLQTMLDRYSRATTSDWRYLAPELAAVWSAALRCNADIGPEGCRFLQEFQCALKRTCGSDEHVAVFLRKNPGERAPWDDLHGRLQAAVQNGQTRLEDRLAEVDALLKKVHR